MVLCAPFQINSIQFARTKPGGVDAPPGWCYGKNCLWASDSYVLDYAGHLWPKCGGGVIPSNSNIAGFRINLETSEFILFTIIGAR